ncbi:MAG TPA: hypothetical protein VG456_20780 [Candidatus Sulfopaludibacter sp.]|nr:hypothetical protein [Candidatus Sulfopaludibacter sp.]
MTGAPIRLRQAVGLRDGRGLVHAGSFLRERRIAFDCTQAEFPRILVHELFHFVWLRLGNPARWSWEARVREEWRGGVLGELGWSAEWRKLELRARDVAARSTLWRLYCCESFCDTAAWLYSGVARHAEFTLAGNPCRARRRWFVETIETRQLSI